MATNIYTIWRFHIHVSSIIYSIIINHIFIFIFIFIFFLNEMPKKKWFENQLFRSFLILLIAHFSFFSAIFRKKRTFRQGIPSVFTPTKRYNLVFFIELYILFHDYTLYYICIFERFSTISLFNRSSSFSCSSNSALRAVKRSAKLKSSSSSGSPTYRPGVRT